MSAPTPNLCEHRQNPKACIQCFHAARLKPKPKDEPRVPAITAGIPQGQLPPISGVAPAGHAPPPVADDKVWQPPAHPSLADRTNYRPPQ